MTTRLICRYQAAARSFRCCRGDWPCRHRPTGCDGTSCPPAHVVETRNRRACGAAGTWASSASAACGTCAGSDGLGCGSSWPASCSSRPASCLLPKAADSARASRRSVPAPGPHSRAAAGSTRPDIRSHFALARRQELIEDHLCTVGEVAELRLPHGERIGFGQRIAVLEPEHRFFRQHRVDDLEACLIRRDVPERREAAFGFLVGQNGMALRKRPAFARPGQRGVPESLLDSSDPNASARPSPSRYPRPVSTISAPPVEQTFDGLVDVEIRRDRRDVAGRCRAA